MVTWGMINDGTWVNPVKRCLRSTIGGTPSVSLTRIYMYNVNCWHKGTQLFFKRSFPVVVFIFIIRLTQVTYKFDYITHNEETHTTYSNNQRNSP